MAEPTWVRKNLGTIKISARVSCQVQVLAPEYQEMAVVTVEDVRQVARSLEIIASAAERGQRAKARDIQPVTLKKVAK